MTVLVEDAGCCGPASTLALGYENADLAERLNRHGFELQHTVDGLAPRLRAWTSVLRQHLLAAAIPWVLRRLLGRPLRRRHQGRPGKRRAMLIRPRCDLDSGMDVELGADVLDVRIHGSLRDLESGGDLLVG